MHVHQSRLGDPNYQLRGVATRSLILVVPWVNYNNAATVFLTVLSTGHKETHNEPRKPFHAIDKETEILHRWEEDAQL